jgi:hypothetical protein
VDIFLDLTLPPFFFPPPPSCAISAMALLSL